MPYKKYKKSNYRKRRNYNPSVRYMCHLKRSYFVNNLLVLTNPNKTLFGNRKYVNLRYQETFSVALPALNAVDDRIFSASDLDDPDVTGVGHQPRGYDEIQALFNHWVVLSSKCTVQWVTAGTGSNRPAMYCMIKLGDNNTGITAINEFMEDRNIKYKLANPGGSQTQVTQYYNAKRFFTVTDPLDNDLLRGSLDTGPADNAFFHIGTANAFSDVGTPSYAFQVIIDYKVVFFEPIQPQQS